MTSLSDTLTVGLVLVLLFGAIALYLYTRIQQAEQKISLLESILLDLKMGLEIKSFSELPAFEHGAEPKGLTSTEDVEDSHGGVEDYTPFQDDQEGLGEVEEIGGTSSTYGVTGEGQVEAKAQVQAQEQEQAQEVEQYKSVIADAVKEEVTITATTQSSPYDNMTLKELQALAKTRGITGAGTMKKGPILEALKTSDKIQHTPSEAGFGATTSTFLDTSAAFPSSESS
jgi:hypothetical protein